MGYNISNVLFSVLNNTAFFLVFITLLISVGITIRFRWLLIQAKKGREDIAVANQIELRAFNQKYNKLNEQLRFTLAGAKAGTLLYHCHNQKLELDNRACELLALYPKDGFFQLDEMLEQLDENDGQVIRKKFYEALKNSQFWQGKFTLKPDQKFFRYIDIHCYINRNENGQSLTVYGMLTDITSRKLREDILVENENRFRLVFEKSKSGLMLIDANKVIRNVNQAGCDILGISKAELVSKTYDSLDMRVTSDAGREFDPDKWPVSISLNQGVEVKPRDFAVSINNKSYWLRISSVPLFKEGNLWPHMVYLHFEDISGQKKMINELLRSENKYRQLADNALVGIFRATNNGEFSYINKSLSNLLELNSQVDVIGKDPMLWFADNNQRRLFYNTLGEKKVIENLHVDLRTLKKNTVKVVVNAQWENDSISGMVMDITEIIKTRDELKESQENFERIFTSMQEGYLRTNLSGKILSVNPSALKLLGYSKQEDLLNLSIKKQVFKKGSSLEEVKAMLAHKESLNTFSIDLVKKSGVNIKAEFNIHYVNNKNGRPQYIECTFRDSTYRKMFEEALKSLLELNRVMEGFSLNDVVNNGLEEAVRLTESKIGFFHFVNEDGKTIQLQSWSKETMKQCEVPEKEEHYPVEVAGIWADCLRYGKPVIHNDYEGLAHKNGMPEGHFPLIREAVVPIYEGSKIVAVIGVGNKNEYYNEFDLDQLLLLGENLWSIIRRKKVEEELIVARNQAVSANNAKSAFLANVTHEIRTPMNAVIGFSELLIKQINDPVQQNYLSAIKASGNALLHIINDILDLSKIEAGKMNISIEPSDIKMVFNDIERIFTLKALQKDIKLKFVLPQELDYLFEIDEMRIRQVLLNLVGNAIKFTNEGYVKVSLEIINLNRNKTKCNLLIKVEDTGIGISEESKEKIFESFRQQDEQDIKKYGGTGLGLAISKRLVNLMKGDIKVKSDVGKGSAFLVTLKKVGLVKKLKPATKAKPDSYHKFDFEKSRIMVVDDIEVNRQLINGVLRGTDIEVIEAADGLQAITIARENQPDLILMDIRMPQLDGYDATNEIRKIEGCENIPIIALTASLNAGADPSKNVRFDGLLRKPVTVKQLLNELHKYLPLKANNLSDNDTTAELTDFHISKEFNNIVETLLMPEWNNVYDTDNMDDVLNYAKILKTTGDKFDVGFLVDYSVEIEKYAKSFDVENLMALLKTVAKTFNKITETAK